MKLIYNELSLIFFIKLFKLMKIESDNKFDIIFYIEYHLSWYIIGPVNAGRVVLVGKNSVSSINFENYWSTGIFFWVKFR